MKLSNSLISILQSRGYCVSEISQDDDYWGTTYVISKAIPTKRVGIELIVDSGNSVEDFIEAIERKKSDYEDMDCDINEDVVSFAIASIEEIITLSEKWEEIKRRCSYV